LTSASTDDNVIKDNFLLSKISHKICYYSGFNAVIAIGSVATKNVAIIIWQVEILLGKLQLQRVCNKII